MIFIFKIIIILICLFGAQVTFFTIRVFYRFLWVKVFMETVISYWVKQCLKHSVSHGKNCFPRDKIHIFGEVPLAKFGFQGLNLRDINLFGVTYTHGQEKQPTATV